MKKLLLVVSAAALLAIPAAKAQRVNKDALLQKLEKSDADILDAKKNAKASTWLNRGKVYFEAEAEPTKVLYVDLEPMLLEYNMGAPKEKKEGVEVAGKVYTEFDYPWVKVYLADGKVKTWRQTRFVKDGTLETAFEAYKKAYEIDPKSASRVKAGLDMIVNYCSQSGNISIDLGEYGKASDMYAMAFDVQSVPVYETANPEFLFYAGQLAAYNGANDTSWCRKGASYLETAIDKGYTDEAGDIYYYLFHCYYGQRAENPEMLMSAKKVLLEGIDKFPKNERILDGLISLYTTEQGVGDPSELIALIDEAIEREPNNPDRWFSRAQIYNKLQNYDECIASFQKMTELKPDDFTAYFYLGFFYIAKGDALNEQMREKNYLSNAEFDADLKAVNSVYMQAVPVFEKALTLKENDLDTVDYLKAVCFRLRDEEGMMSKYEHYNALWKQLKGME